MPTLILFQSMFSSLSPISRSLLILLCFCFSGVCTLVATFYIIYVYIGLNDLTYFKLQGFVFVFMYGILLAALCSQVLVFAFLVKSFTQTWSYQWLRVTCVTSPVMWHQCTFSRVTLNKIFLLYNLQYNTQKAHTKTAHHHYSAAPLLSIAWLACILLVEVDDTARATTGSMCVANLTARPPHSPGYEAHGQ